MFPLAKLPIAETPVAVLDFETTGVAPGRDRVVEVAVARVDPGQKPRLVFNTLVNPRRRMACTEIHGITDEDVADAPEFGEIANDLMAAIGGCAVAAYNVYFDLKFLKYELDRAGRDCTPPHFCLMYMRPMLDMGDRCSLVDACREHGISADGQHHAAADAMPGAELYGIYQTVLRNRRVRTFGDLADLRSYKFCDSFQFSLPPEMVGGTCQRLKPRGAATSWPSPTPASAESVPVKESNRFSSAKGIPEFSTTITNAAVTITFAAGRQGALREYWDVLKLVISDLDVSDEELAYVERKKVELNLDESEIRAQHARVFASVIAQFTDDRRIDDRERDKLRRLHLALSRLGWAPGE